MKLYILLLLTIFIPISAAELRPAPPRKRWALQEINRQEESKAAKIEEKEEDLPATMGEQSELAKVSKVEAVTPEPPTLAKLPTELKERIFKALLVEKGLGKKKLFKAVQNIANVRLAAPILTPILDDPAVVDYIIKELARRYTMGDVIQVVIAWGSKQAADWLHEALIKEIKLENQPRAAGEIIAAKIRLPYILSQAIIRAVFNDEPDVAKFLLNSAYMPEYKTYLVYLNAYDRNGGNSFLMAIAKLADTEILARILNRQVLHLINDLNEDTQTALSYAIMSGNVQNVDLLLNAGAQTVWKEPGNNQVSGTALYYAARANNLELVEKFLQDPKVVEQIGFQDCDARSALSYAIIYNNYPMFSRLIDVPGIDLHGPLHEALNANIQMVKDLVARKVEIDPRHIFSIFYDDVHKKSSLDDETMSEMVKLLLAGGAQVNIHDDCNLQKTPLIHAVEQAKYKTVLALLEAGANPNIPGAYSGDNPDIQNHVPLWYANQLKTSNKKNIIDLLKRYGAKE